MKLCFRLNVVIAIVSNAWDDSDTETQEVFWESRLSMLFNYRSFQRLVRDKKCGRIYRMIESTDIDSLSDLKSFVDLPKNILCLTLGLFTFGLCWPTSLREKILSTGMVETALEDIEESKKEK